MNDEEVTRRSDWYRPMEGELPPIKSRPEEKTPAPAVKRGGYYTDPYWSEEEAVKKALKRTRMRTIMICLFVVLLIVATAFIFSQKDEAPYPGAPDTYSDSPEDYDDFQDFFQNYYTKPEVTTGENTVERAPTGTGVTLTLSPAGGNALSLQEIYDKCADSIVSINSDVDNTSYYWGSGIVMTEDGYILTNTHLLEGVRNVTVTTSTGEAYDAKVVGYDAISDIAVLKIDALGLTPAEFADSSSLRVGDNVAAIGNPLGETFRGTMTNGIISAISRDIDYNGHTMTLLQTNTAINNGSSGGALIDMQGRVVGMTNMKMMSYFSSIEGIAFAIPTSTMKTVVDALIESGRVSGRPALGITVGAVPESAADYYDLPDGLYVSDVAKNSDAAAKGVRVGDVITAVNGQAVSTVNDMAAIKDGLKVGDTMTLTVFRSGKTFDVTVALLETDDVY